MRWVEAFYIVLPPALALLIAAFLSWQGNRATAKLDREIAEYRARKAAK
jgi:hypothetical protein